MKNLLRIPFSNVSILTRIVAAILISITYLWSATPTYAACVTSNVAACPPNATYACSYTSPGGVSTSACCSDAASCTAFKVAAANSTVSTTNQAGSATSGVLKVNPEAGCSDGINTALGCIPYETKGFTNSLLKFLIGVIGLIAIIVMLVATIMIMTGGSNPEQVKKGKELFTGGITGLLFIIFSVTLLRIIAGDIIKLPGF